MSIKKKQVRPVDPRPCFNPYRLDPADDLGVCYARYMADPARIMRLDGRTYYRIFECLPFDLSGRRGVLVWMTVEMPFAAGDVLTDENGICFKPQIVLFRFQPKGLPDHSKRIYPLFLTGNTDRLGEYLARKE